MKLQSTILKGDCISRLKDLPDKSVHCVITSPPYWALRSYGGDKGMIGMEPTFEEHLDNLVTVFREVYRVLRDDGTLWLNYGDAYVGGGRGGGSKGKEATGDPQRGGKTTSKTNLTSKNLMMMPSRVAMALQEDGIPDLKALRIIEQVRESLIDEYNGEIQAPVLDRLEQEYWEAKGKSWILRSEIIWWKPNPMPESTKDRPTNAHEKIFLFTKKPKYFYDAEAVRTKGKGKGVSTTKFPDGWDTEPGTHGSIHRKGRADNHKTRKRYPTKDVNGIRNRETYDNLDEAGRVAYGANLRNVWPVTTEGFKQAHFAVFPPELIMPCIKAGTSTMGVCSECGDPYRRDVLVSYTDGIPNGPKVKFQEGSYYTERKEKIVETKGWKLTCDCKNPEPVPATILDPFGGSGTVGVVASQQNRNSIIIEINQKYVDMAYKRVRHSKGAMFLEVHRK